MKSETSGGTLSLASSLIFFEKKEREREGHSSLYHSSLYHSSLPRTSLRLFEK